MPNLIYEPKGRAREYAALACNVYSGCDHECIYCYAPSATQRVRSQFVLSKPRADFIPNLVKEAAKLQRSGVSGQVLLSFTCDPYQHLDDRERTTRETIRILHQQGFTVCILTKGGSRALRDLDLLSPCDTFATTLTLLDDKRSKEWEPEAALPGDRIETIQTFHAAGIPTWVSLEPVLDPAAALEIIRRTHTFVDLYKVGRLNYHPHARTIDWKRFATEVCDLLDGLGKRYYVKKDLAILLDSPHGEPDPDKLLLQAAPASLPAQVSLF